MPTDIPDFTMKPTFPVASVIDAAQRNAQLQLQAQQAGQQSLVQGLQAIGGIGQSLYEQRVRMAQALAGAKMYGQTPEGQQMLGTNQVTTTPQGPVQQNQTAAYNPETGTTTPNQSSVTPQDIATSMYGMAPKDMMEHLIQSRIAGTGAGELALKQQTEPQKIAIEGKKAISEIENTAIMRQIQAMLGAATIKNQQQERAQAAQNAEYEANKAILGAGSPLNPFNPVTYAQKKAAIQAMVGSGQGSTPVLPAVGQTVTHLSGVKITRTK